MERQINTIEDLYEYAYGNALNEYMKLQKSDAPFKTDTTGVLNKVYGAKAFEQICTEQNVLGVLPKKPWRSGYRAITDAGLTGGGIAEGGDLTDAQKPTLAEINITLKEMENGIQFTTKTMHLVDAGVDDIIDKNALRESCASRHGLLINNALCCDVDTLAGNNVESIDRVTSSYSEVTNCGITAGDSDIYGLDRDAAASWADAQVLHNSNSDRVLTLDLIDDLIQATAPYAQGQQVFITGYDTYRKWNSLLDAKRQYFDYKPTKITLNGITTEGIDAGNKTATYDGIPIIISNSVAKDTISRIYLLDTENLFFALPPNGMTKYIETKPEDVALLGKMAVEGRFITAGELICTKFSAQGKLRDLKSA